MAVARPTPALALALLSLLSLSVSRSPANATAAATCTTSLDCRLNGACTAGACVCDQGWKGAQCAELDLVGEAVVSYGYGGSEANTSSWGGGPALLDPASPAASRYHFFVTEIAGHCGMATWARMSQIVHAVGPTSVGPFQRVSTAVGTQAHNAFPIEIPGQGYVLFHIFDGKSPESCNPFKRCDNGTTPGGHGIRPPPGPWPAPTCRAQGGAHMHFSKSLNGPWLSAGPVVVANASALPATAGTSNPSPLVLADGSMLVIMRGKDAHRENGTVVAYHNLFLFHASAWNGTYHWLPGKGDLGALNIGNGKQLTEDPCMYRGRRGFHALLHSGQDLTHAYAEAGSDGLPGDWHWDSELIGPPSAQGTSPNERPRVLLTDAGDVSVVWVAQELGTGDASRTAAYRVRPRGQQ